MINKKLKFLLVGMLLPGLQSCTKEKKQPNMYLNSQQRIEEFAKTGMTAVGLLIIEDEDTGSVTDLTPLAGIRSVEHLQILRTDSLFSLDGLSNLSYIGAISVIGANGLTALTGLPEIETLDGDLQITGNPKLTDITVFSSLSFIGGNFEVTADTLLDISVFANLNHIEGDCLFNFNSSHSQNIIEELPNLRHVGGSLQIEKAANLTAIRGLDNLRYIGENLIIKDNPELLTSGFCGLRSFFAEGELVGDTTITGNGENPTVEEILTACE